MSLPTTPGLYEDNRGDTWVLDESGWRHHERRLTDGTIWPVDYPGPIGADALETLASEPGVDLLPLKRIGDLPVD